MARILIGNIKGPKGDTGPQGKQGPTGPQGPKGDTGPMPALINNAATTSAGVGALDAAMGKTLSDQIAVLNSELEIKQLSQGQTILDFALENADNRVTGFIVLDVYPEDSPENSEFFVHIYRDESFSRLLVKLTPYGRTAYSYERRIFQGNWQDDTWRKLSYTQIHLSGIAATDSQGYATVTFSTPLDVVPRIFLQWISDDDMILSIAKPMNISKTGFKIRVLKLDGTEIVANSNASVSWIAVA